jgi:hypothetical protein
VLSSTGLAKLQGMREISLSLLVTISPLLGLSFMNTRKALATLFDLFL